MFELPECVRVCENTVMLRLTTGIHYEKCVVRGFRH